MNGAIRSTTFRPVSKTSVVGWRSSNVGGSRWIGHRSPASTGSSESIGSPRTLKIRPERRLAHRHRDRRAGVDHVDPARDPVRRVHRDRTDPVVAQMLLHLGDQHAIRAVVGRHRDLQGRVDFRQVVGESGVDDDASDLDHLADVLFRHASPRGSETGDLGGAPPAACSLPNALGIASRCRLEAGALCRRGRLGRFNPVCAANSEPGPCAPQQTRSGRQG
jgi:hypothetical protein